MGMKLLVVSGSRADRGMLEWPLRLLRADPFFSVELQSLRWLGPADALSSTTVMLNVYKPDMILLLGDRYEIMAAALAAHLQRVPIAHICGGDVTEGSYDDAMRDCISRMATIHFPTSWPSAERLRGLSASGDPCEHAYPQDSVHMVGSPGIDYIMHGDWKRDGPPMSPLRNTPYVVVSYQAETIDGTIEFDEVIKAIPNGIHPVFITPNPDAGSDIITKLIFDYIPGPGGTHWASTNHDDFLNLLFYCQEFIGNSSAIFYEAPFIRHGGVPCKLIGKRQRGRVVPFGDGRASERIVKILKDWHALQADSAS